MNGEHQTSEKTHLDSYRSTVSLSPLHRIKQLLI